MMLKQLSPGACIPDEFTVVIEISAHSDPIKYEVDADTGVLCVDRFISTGMRYPANYGFIPSTLAKDGDPVDVLVLTPFPIMAGAVVSCRALGVLQMSDERGPDAKLLAVPIDKVCPMSAALRSIDDIDKLTKSGIQHFFEHYKALEEGKWVKVEGWLGIEQAHQEIIKGIEDFQQKKSS